MSLNNKAASFDSTPYQELPISCARDLPLPKRSGKNIKWEKSAKYKVSKQKQSKKKANPSATKVLIDTATLPLSSTSINSEGASCSTDSCQFDLVTANSLDKDDAMLVAALLSYDPSIALVLNANSN